ncbi:hypothetical protein Lal_00001750 [Lupinus albus]|nr:hypothetical protein Lal_00001750 [Lupinus albus]
MICFTDSSMDFDHSMLAGGCRLRMKFISYFIIASLFLNSRSRRKQLRWSVCEGNTIFIFCIRLVVEKPREKKENETFITEKRERTTKGMKHILWNRKQSPIGIQKNYQELV